MWQWVAVQIVIAVASYLLRPKPKTTTPAAMTGIDVPTVSEGTTLPVLFGTRDLTNIQVVTYGKIRAEAVKA